MLKNGILRLNNRNIFLLRLIIEKCHIFGTLSNKKLACQVRSGGKIEAEIILVIWVCGWRVGRLAATLAK